MKLLVDSSAFAKRYVREVGSEKLDENGMLICLSHQTEGN